MGCSEPAEGCRWRLSKAWPRGIDRRIAAVDAPAQWQISLPWVCVPDTTLFSHDDNAPRNWQGSIYEREDQAHDDLQS